MIYFPPDNIATRDRTKKSIFLAGSIDNGKTVDWQSIEMGFYTNQNFDIFNPRRKDWDSSWVQDFENPQFSQQVMWELNALNNADYIIMFFAPGSVSPISLLEFGLYATSGKMFVVCEDFWRKGNVDIVAQFHNIPLFKSLEDIRYHILKINK